MKFLFILTIILSLRSICMGSPLPNIILIMADDMGYGDLSSYGSSRNSTPHIDQLAADGVRFSQFYANAPVCTPTRAALLTGQYQQRSGFFDGVLFTGNDDRKGMPLEKLTLAEALKAEGYSTGIFGKWHLGVHPSFNPIQQGFDRFIGFRTGNIDYHSKVDPKGRYDWVDGITELREDGYITALNSADALAFIHENQAGPFFLYMAYAAPHYPWQGPDDEIVRVEGSSGGAGRYNQTKYANMITSMDNGVKEIRDLLETLGIKNNTIIIFCSDNGARSEGENGILKGDKASLWEGGIRVPGMIAWPEHITPGQESDQVITTMDVFPTLFALINRPLPSGLTLDGLNLSSQILNGTETEREPLFWEWGSQACLRDGDWKLTRNVGNTSNTQLYNLALDPQESNDLASEHPDRVASMSTQLTDWETLMDAAAPSTIFPSAFTDDLIMETTTP